MQQQWPRERGQIRFGSLIRIITEIFSLGLLIGILIRLQRNRHGDDDHNLLQVVGNPGFSPASAAVMQLYREGKLFGDESILRGTNLMAANWQRVIMPEVNLEGVNLMRTFATLCLNTPT